MRRWAGVVGATMALAVTAGCIRQQMVIRSTPPGALVSVNGHEVGTTPVTVLFDWYSDYRIRVEAEGYKALEQLEPVVAPWYMWIPLDLATTLLPWMVVDSHVFDYALTPPSAVREQEVGDDGTGDAVGAGQR